MEGAIFVTGAAVQWLRDGLGIIADAAETGPLAASVPDTGGVYVVPAFTGLGSPWWDPYARGTIVGITRGTTPRAPRARGRRGDGVPDRRRRRRDHARRAAPRSPEMRVDGGASVMDLLCQFQADLLGVPVRRAAVQETTALGAAFLAGIAEGVWDSPAAGRTPRWQADASFTPAMDADERDARHGRRGTARSSARATGHASELARLRSRGLGRADVVERRDAARSSVGMSSACFVAYVSTYS